MDGPDALLLDRWAREHDGEAFQEIVERHSRMVYATARRILGDSHRAEDVTQECFLRVSQCGGSGRRSLAAWLHRVATNIAISFLRSDRRQRSRVLQPRPLPDASEEMAWSEVQAIIDEAIASLPDPLRIPIVEHFLNGRTHASIASDLNLTREAVGYRVRTGIEAIRRKLRRRGMLPSATALAAGLSSLSDLSAAPLPPPLRGALGKMAVAGPELPGSICGAATGSTVLLGVTMKTLLAFLVTGTIVVGIVAAGIHFWTAGEDAPPSQPETARGSELKQVIPETPSEPQVVDRASSPPPVPAEETPPRALIGRVVTGKGEPIAGAAVYLAIHHGGVLDSRSYWKRTACLSTASDGAGQFRFEWIPEKGLASVTAGRDDLWTPWKPFRIEKQEGTPVMLALQTGARVRGIVVSMSGEPVGDAIVSVCHAWDEKDYLSSMVFCPTGADGSFDLAVNARATQVSLRASSDSLGEQFFFDLPVKGEQHVLRFREPAAIRGRIVWDDGRPAAGMAVRLQAQVPRPAPLARSTALVGGLELLTLHAEVGESGVYGIRALPPDFRFEIFVLDPASSKLEPLSPRWTQRFRIASGETKVWDYTLTRRMRIFGRLLTEASRRPVPGMQVGVFKDGKLLPSPTALGETGKDGAYQIALTTGPGEYRLSPTPEASFEALTAFIGERFGKTLALRGGEELEVDLEIYEPIRIPVRVRDPEGRPAGSIEAKLSVTLPNGKGFGFESPYPLGDDGKHVFEIFCPVKHVSLALSAFPEGPRVRTGNLVAEVGRELGEIAIDLPATCNVRGTVRDARGELVANSWIEISALHADVDIYADDGVDSCTCKSDAKGNFTKMRRIRAAPVTLEVSVRDGKGTWKSQPLSPRAGEMLDLGEIALSE